MKGLRTYLGLLVGFAGVLTILVLASSLERPTYVVYLPDPRHFILPIAVGVFLFLISLLTASGARVFVWLALSGGLVVIGRSIWFNTLLKWSAIATGGLLITGILLAVLARFSELGPTERRSSRNRFIGLLLTVLILFASGQLIINQDRRVNRARALLHPSSTVLHSPKGREFVDINYDIAPFDQVISALVDGIALEVPQYAQRMQELAELARKMEEESQRRKQQSSEDKFRAMSIGLEGVIQHLEAAAQIGGGQIAESISPKEMLLNVGASALGFGDVMSTLSMVEQANTMAGMTNEISQATLEMQRSFEKITESSESRETGDYSRIFAIGIGWKAAQAATVCRFYAAHGPTDTRVDASAWQDVLDVWEDWFHAETELEVSRSIGASPWAVTVWSPVDGVRVSNSHLGATEFLEGIVASWQNVPRTTLNTLESQLRAPSRHALSSGYVWRMYIGDRRWDAQARFAWPEPGNSGWLHRLAFVDKYSREYPDGRSGWTVEPEIPRNGTIGRVRLSRTERTLLNTIAYEVRSVRRIIDEFRSTNLFPEFLDHFRSIDPHWPHLPEGEAIHAQIQELSYLDTMVALLGREAPSEMLIDDPQQGWVMIDFSVRVESVRRILDRFRTLQAFKDHLRKHLELLGVSMEQL